MSRRKVSPNSVGMLLCFFAGGLVVSAVAAVWQSSSIVPPANAQHNQGRFQPAASVAPWLKGTSDEKFTQIERHLRGLDVCMAEIGYRYAELLSAGKTRNWEYAQYQTEKIDLSLRLAIERRPKRAKSSDAFLNRSLPEVMQAIKAKDESMLDAALDKLRVGCIQCHRAENVLYMGQLFATIQPTPPATFKAIQEYKMKLTADYLRTADRSQGRLIFSKNCANCHKLFGEGADNSPDLTGLQRSNLNYLLNTIIDPNAVIGHDYQAVIVLTTNGKVVTGLVQQEDEKTLTIESAKGTSVTEKMVIPKEEIEERSASKVSFMPEGMLQKLSDEEVRDLISYLQGPAQLPLPPEKSDEDTKQTESSAKDGNIREDAKKLFGVIEAVPKRKLTDPDVTLGRALFWDTRLSGNGKTACASCHLPDDWGADRRKFSLDAKGKNTTRNSQTIFNAVLQPSLRWTGDRKSGAHQAEKSLTGSMGLASAEAVVPLLRDLGYEAAFKAAFGKDVDPVSPANYAAAIQAYEETLVTPAPFDRYLAGDDDALTKNQKAGLAMFMSRGCADCHSGPLLGGTSIRKFGVVKDYWTVTKSEKQDAGLFEATKNEADRSKFRVSMLRNIAKTGPYFHDGSVADLKEAVQVMADVQLGERLSDSDASAIVSVLDALTGDLPKNYCPPKASVRDSTNK